MASLTEKQLTEQQRKDFYRMLADGIPTRDGGTSLHYDAVSYHVGRLYSVTYSVALDTANNSYFSIWVANSYFSVYEKKDDVLSDQYKAMWTAADNRFNNKDYVDPFGYKDAMQKKLHDGNVRG